MQPESSMGCRVERCAAPWAAFSCRAEAGSRARPRAGCSWTEQYSGCQSQGTDRQAEELGWWWLCSQTSPVRFVPLPDRQGALQTLPVEEWDCLPRRASLFFRTACILGEVSLCVGSQGGAG